MGTRQHIQAISAIAERHGFRLLRKKKHLIFVGADGRWRVVVGKTPSCHHALANVEATFRNAALKP